MKTSTYILVLCLVLVLLGVRNIGYSQSTLIENGGFEADWPNQFYPSGNQPLYMISPYPWMDFNPGDNERWFIDSVWPTNTNLPDPNFQKGYYSLTWDDIGAPWEDGDDMLPQAAHSGRGYVGFDARSDWFTREGIQTKVLNDCGLNTGDYTVSLWWARAFPGAISEFYVHLSDQSGSRRKEIGSHNVSLAHFTPGE